MTNESLARRLRILRAARGITLAEAEELTGVTRETLGALEHGQRGAYTSTLQKIAEGYGTTVSALLEEDPEAALVGPPKAEAPPETGPASSPLLEDPRVMDWLQGQDAAFVLMSDKDFEDVVVSLDLQDIPSLRSQLDDERLRLEQELDKTDVKKTLFPTHVQGLQVREERIREAMRPYRQAGRLRVLLGREYFIRRSVLENYHRHLLELRPNEANDLSTRRRALREEASLVGATS